MTTFDVARWTAYGRWATGSLFRRYAVRRWPSTPAQWVPAWRERLTARDETGPVGAVL